MNIGISTLNAMFGYNTPIPDAPVTRQHRIGIRDSRFTQPVERVVKLKPVKNPNKLKDSWRRVLQIVNCNQGVTGISVAKKTKWTQNYCSDILTALFKRGLIRRVQRTAPNIRYYEYFKLDSAQ